MNKIFLHGGGDDPAGRRAAYGPFVATLPEKMKDPLVLIIAVAKETDHQENAQYYTDVFTSLGIPRTMILPLFVTPQQPLTYETLASCSPAGIFICGGATSTYYDSLCRDLSWVNFLRATDTPFMGTSAGAAIAATQAILGGWQTQRHGNVRQILVSGAGEGLDILTVKPDLGLVPFSIDVHASQWGTLTRLVHAVDLGLVAEGWAIDENTTLVVEEAALHVHGMGQAYHVRPDANGTLSLSIHYPDQSHSI